MGRSAGGGGHGNPLQNSCLESPMDWGTWWSIVSQSCNWSHLICTHTFRYMYIHTTSINMYIYMHILSFDPPSQALSPLPWPAVANSPQLTFVAALPRLSKTWEPCYWWGLSAQPLPWFTHFLLSWVVYLLGWWVPAGTDSQDQDLNFCVSLRCRTSGASWWVVSLSWVTKTHWPTQGLWAKPGQVPGD